MLAPPPKIKVSILNQTHAEYDAARDSDLWSLYKGGRAVTSQPERFLTQRPAEPDGRFARRCKLFYYLGYVGEIIDSFASQLFMAPPGLAVGPKREPLPEFWAEWIQDVDRVSTTLQSFARNRMLHALAQRWTYTLVDLPQVAPTDEKISVAAADALGITRPYLVPIDASELIDFECTDEGDFNWVTLRQQHDYRPNPFADKMLRRFRWTTLDREGFAIYEFEAELKFDQGVLRQKKELRGAEAELLVEGKHRFKRVPLVPLVMSEGLWVGGKLESIQKQITELDNGLSWQQLQSLYAMPVIKSDKPWKPTPMGESNFIQIGQSDALEWTEPAGTAFATSLEQRKVLKEELFRVAHQMAQSVGADESTAGRSGESKKRDQNPTLVVLEELSTRMSEHIAQIVELCQVARDETLDIAVTGMDEFDLEDSSEFLADAAVAQALAIPSPTAKREIAKRVVRSLLPKITPDTQERIDAEIAAAPDSVFANFDPMLGAPPDQNGNNPPAA